MFRAYSYGKETVPVFGVSVEDGTAVVVGSAYQSRYRLMIVRLDSHGDVIWKKFYGGENDWEGQYIIRARDGYVVAGGVDGVATSTGGRDWKGYLLKIDENGEKLWERKYTIRGNECIYSAIADSNGFLLAGITQSARSHPFLLKTDAEGNLLETNVFKEADTMLGVARTLAGVLLGVADWKRNIAYMLLVNHDDEPEQTAVFDDTLLMNMFKFGDEIFVVGEKAGNAYIAKVSDSGELLCERSYEAGTGIAMVKTGSGYIIGGEQGGAPFAYRLNASCEITERFTAELWNKGWVETIINVKEKLLLAGPVTGTEKIDMGVSII